MVGKARVVLMKLLRDVAYKGVRNITSCEECDWFYVEGTRPRHNRGCSMFNPALPIA